MTAAPLEGYGDKPVLTLKVFLKTRKNENRDAPQFAATMECEDTVLVSGVGNTVFEAIENAKSTLVTRSINEFKAAKAATPPG